MGPALKNLTPKGYRSCQNRERESRTICRSDGLDPSDSRFMNYRMGGSAKMVMSRDYRNNGGRGPSGALLVVLLAQRLDHILGGLLREFVQ
jgi:hypothetical protein